MEATGARRVVLVSCDVGSMGRDIHLLRQLGFELTSESPVDMFPHTCHVEVVSVLDRSVKRQTTQGISSSTEIATSGQKAGLMAQPAATVSTRR